MKAVETIYYQGRRTGVRVISEINTEAHDGTGYGMEFLLRDEQGRYYLRRELYDEDVGYYCARRTRKYGYRCLLHRISLAAAALWQISICAQGVLRNETAALLMAGRKAIGMNRIPSRIVVELDDEASKLLRDCLSGVGQSCLEDGADPRDIVSAAIVFLLDDPDKSDWFTSQDALDRARERRLAAEKGGVA